MVAICWGFLFIIVTCDFGLCLVCLFGCFVVLLVVLIVGGLFWCRVLLVGCFAVGGLAGFALCLRRWW